MVINGVLLFFSVMECSCNQSSSNQSNALKKRSRNKNIIKSKKSSSVSREKSGNDVVLKSLSNQSVVDPSNIISDFSKTNLVDVFSGCRISNGSTQLRETSHTTDGSHTTEETSHDTDGSTLCTPNTDIQVSTYKKQIESPPERLPHLLLLIKNPQKYIGCADIQGVYVQQPFAQAIIFKSRFEGLFVRKLFCSFPKYF